MLLSATLANTTLGLPVLLILRRASPASAMLGLLDLDLLKSIVVHAILRSATLVAIAIGLVEPVRSPIVQVINELGELHDVANI